MAENKVQFNLKNVHYALLTEGATNTWATPVAVPGAVSLTLSAEGGDTNFYADGVTYYRTVQNNGYSGSIEMARIPDAMRVAIFGETLDNTSKVQFEKTGVQPLPFALLFEIEGDAEHEQFVFYRCIAKRPSVSATTNEDAANVQTQTFDLAVLPVVTGAAKEQGLIKGKTTATTTTTAKNAWYTSVQLPTA